MDNSLDQSSPPRSHSSVPTKIALIGCGAIAENYYLPALMEFPSVLKNLILVDIDKARIQRLAEKFAIPHIHQDYREVLNIATGAIVALPTHLHHPVSMELLANGVHVLCEKPLAESETKASEMVEKARETGSALAVNYLQRLIPSFAEVKKLLADKTLGEPLSIHYVVGEKFEWPTVSGFYFNSKSSNRGVLLDRGAHVVDHICWWLGEKPQLISSQNDSFGGSEAVAQLEFSSGNCVGTIKLSWLSSFPCKYFIECESGMIEGDVYDYQSLLVSSNNGRKRRLKFASLNKADIALKIVANFIDVVREGATPFVSGSEVLDSMKLIDECYESARKFDMPWYGNVEVTHAA